MVKTPPATQETWVRFLEEGTATRSGILAWRAPLDRGASWAMVHRVTESDTTEGLSTAQLPGQSPHSEGSAVLPNMSKDAL